MKTHKQSRITASCKVVSELKDEMTLTKKQIEKAEFVNRSIEDKLAVCILEERSVQS